LGFHSLSLGTGQDVPIGRGRRVAAELLDFLPS
jgi:hypothetical protein